MDVKTNLQVIICMIAFFECDAAALLRTPKVYNALITTDQNLTPSRAYPVIQPALQDPFFYGPYGYTPYGGYYDPFGFNPFESAAYVPKYGANADGTINVNAATDESVQRSASAGKDETAVIQNTNTEKSPIPLNEFGFPPSLIQLSPGKNPVNLAPFAYNSYPLIYDQFSGYPQSAYLPHFGVLPQTAYGPYAGITPTAIDGSIGGEKAPIGSNFGGAPGAGGVGNVGGNGNVGGVGNTAGLVPGFANSGVPVATPIAPGVAGLNGPAPPQSAYGTVADALNPIYFDRENGVSQGGGFNPAANYGDNGGINNGVNNGIGNGKVNDVNGGYDGSGIDDLNNNGFRTAASNNAAYGGVNGNRSANRGVVNDARLRGSAPSTSGNAQSSGVGIRSTSSSSSTSTSSNAASGSGSNSAGDSENRNNKNAVTSNASNGGGVGFRSSSPSSRSQGQSSFSSSNGSQGQSSFSSSNGSQGSFVSGSQNIAKN
ncbi:uncharacterized transmembrane protein DDB_G0289901 [Contarinia nasturtii]|uniref:uncharacterized transmembrane protein DDB_G0289901 n=1 Tax=Contarinia nasturtii TaxID=265458 RepID=UPI0012D3F02F|nr:uncharacterized transmembrane protein DDB_G0289901 [Contarinia nasturtii]XP_031619724.1 uncharacterized transmembrane protein DDB_G0289901 [Contarinia nasturtii]XP_031619725.1 uncharacterized transmembrane protein DDB_G0289901 [Contarinia nasturtii]XP_031619727.1 uncharacterized transmembrane protein DDB_G0289901 [Contarinia nasturtii]